MKTHEIFKKTDKYMLTPPNKIQKEVYRNEAEAARAMAKFDEWFSQNYA